ncbi:MAG TPA: NIPSNAP family protein [Verrucomicrobiae bacterium]|nr:NIPSNAP family protein [Verrucomicrobiae bacterium]
MNKFILVLLSSMLAFATANAAEQDTRCFEMRTYHAAPGKLDDLNARFRNHTMEIFKKHGMENIGYWVPVDNTNNVLIYILAYPSREAREKSWKEFGADPEWQSVQKASEANGKLVTKVDSVFMTATDFSPAVAPSKASQSRLFELRRYHASPGKLDDLLARFRNHTCALFEKHGMGQFGYWVPTDQKQGAGETLIYILAHNDKAASDASWKAFRDDPDWTKVKKDSEVNGPLTVQGGVQSVFMVPTDYSPTK